MFLLKSKKFPLHYTMDFRGLKINIENGKHSARAWKNPDNGTEGMSYMHYAYGEIQGTLGVDGDKVDIIIGPDRDAPNVYIVHQVKAPDFTRYDEDKVMAGFSSEAAAREAYLKQYNDPRFLGPITAMPFEQFCEKIHKLKGKMIKSHVTGHTRVNPSGKVSTVRDYDDSRTKNPDEPVKEFGTFPEDIAKAAGIPPAPIRLVRGRQIDNHRGFGKEHMASQHGEEIRRAGYKSEEDFVEDVVQTFNAVYDAGGGRLALVSESKMGGQKIHIVEIRYQRGQKFYTVVTGYIADWPKFNERKYKLLWKKFAKGLIGFIGLLKSSRPLRKGGEEYCKKIGDSLGVDWKEVDLDEFCDGMFVEEEHQDVTHGDPKLTAKIVLAHLKEDPHYYTKLEKMEKAIKAGAYLLRGRHGNE